MNITNHPIAPGTYRVVMPQEDQDMVKDFRSYDPAMLGGICGYLAEVLGLQYVSHTIYDYALLIKRGLPISGGSSVWHNDSNGHDMDCILMIYNVTPALTASTGMRIGYRDGIETAFLDIATGDAFLHRQDHPRFQHKVEDPTALVQDRACLSINLRGFGALAQAHDLQLS